jgi:hypothetical protein
MDDHHVHQHWGISPFVDLRAVADELGRDGQKQKGGQTAREGGDDDDGDDDELRLLQARGSLLKKDVHDENDTVPFNAVAPLSGPHTQQPAPCATAAAPNTPTPKKQRQVCPYDCRHTLATLCRAERGDDAADAAGATPHGHPQQQQHRRRRRLHLVVYEEEPEALARHMLLLHAALDGGGGGGVRAPAELLLELHGNALLRARTARYLGACGHTAFGGGGGAADDDVCVCVCACVCLSTAAPFVFSPLTCCTQHTHARTHAHTSHHAADASAVLEDVVAAAAAKAAGLQPTTSATSSPLHGQQDAAAAGSPTSGDGDDAATRRGAAVARLGRLFDLSGLRHAERDALAAVLRRWRGKVLFVCLCVCAHTRARPA